MTDDPTQANPTAPTGADEPRVLGGRYEVAELVGRGGMADVHAGHDLRLGRQVAIKILRTDLARDSSFLARFRREAQAAAGLNHPSIVGVFDSGEEVVHEAGGAPLHVPYIVMEYVEGKTLRELLNEHRQLLPDEAARITAAVLSALEYAHDRGLVHRDIKPANVMVTPHGGVKVMDFGIARALADTAATMTQTQAVMGTARYLSPEQAQGLDVDGRSDLYSVGCLLYELLAGRTPFQGDPVSLVYQHLGETPKAPSTHQSHLPQALDAITLHALEKNRDERYQSAADFRADLNAARADESVSAAALASYNKVLGVSGAGAAAIARSQSEERTQAVPMVGAGGVAAAAGAAGAGASAADSRDLLPYGDTEDDRWERTDEMPVRERRHRGAALLLGVLSLLAVAGVAWVLFQVLGPGGEEEPLMVTVPNTVGRTEPQARTELTGLGFTVPPSTERNSDQPQGQVIEQDPPGPELRGRAAQRGGADLDDRDAAHRRGRARHGAVAVGRARRAGAGGRGDRARGRLRAGRDRHRDGHRRAPGAGPGTRPDVGAPSDADGGARTDRRPVADGRDRPGRPLGPTRTAGGARRLTPQGGAGPQPASGGTSPCPASSARRAWLGRKTPVKPGSCASGRSSTAYPRPIASAHCR